MKLVLKFNYNHLILKCFAVCVALQGLTAIAGPVWPYAFRAIDGTGNNLAELELGSAGMPLMRMVAADYDDGMGAPAERDRPSAREVSNIYSIEVGGSSSSSSVTDLFWQWGQFLDHDIDLSPILDPAEPYPISVPMGDPYFDPESSGTVEMPFERSFYEMIDGVRQQLNSITAFIDGSQIYGSTAARANALRRNDGSGQLRTSHGGRFPMYNTEGFSNAPADNDASLFLCGDVRANEQIGLTALHTIFMREHNYWANVIRQRFGSLSGNSIYRWARGLVGAEIQAITYNEFLPLLIGADAIPAYTGYDQNVNPEIANVFSTAAYRLGHSMLPAMLKGITAQGRVYEVPLRDAFFNPQILINNDPSLAIIVRGFASSRAENLDHALVDDVRNFLFGPPGAGGMDLAALNVQRGRDHGLPDYNQVRLGYGLAALGSFGEITSDTYLRGALADLYASVDEIDLWVGGLAETPMPGTMVGETFQVIIADQFIRLRNGDRFFYKNYFGPVLVNLIESQTLSRIIQRNTDGKLKLRDNPFIMAIEPNFQ